MKRYRTIYADPPWRYQRAGRRGAAEKHYRTMALEAICALPVADLAEPRGCHLHLWTTSLKLPEAFRVLDAWGFRYCSSLIWHKTGRIGMGTYWRIDHEILLLGVRGSLPFARHDIRSVIALPRGRHSEKPEGVRILVEAVSPGPRLELFARKHTPGWDVWGDEVEGGIDL